MLLTKAQTALLLGRSLSTAEDTNFATYLKIAEQRLQELLCMDVCGDDGERTYESRYGYREVYVDPFTDITSVTIDDEEVTDYTTKQNDKLNGSWYNIIEFDDKRRGERIVVDADWGFNSLPSDLQLLLGRIFDDISKQNSLDRQINSKKVEDFTITYNHSSITFSDSLWDLLVKDNSSIIAKYAQCNQGMIRHGSVRWGYDDIRSIRSY